MVVLLARGRVSAATVALVGGVLAWWLMIVGAITLAVPTPAAAPAVPEGAKPRVAIVFAPGDLVHVSAPSGALWLMPVDRVTYYEYDRALLDNDADVMAQMRAQPGWVVIVHGQVMGILDVDPTAVQVELLESPNTGRRGWLPVDYLRPYTGGR